MAFCITESALDDRAGRAGTAFWSASQASA